MTYTVRKRIFGQEIPLTWIQIGNDSGESTNN